MVSVLLQLITDSSMTMYDRLTEESVHWILIKALGMGKENLRCFNKYNSASTCVLTCVIYSPQVFCEQK